MANENQSAADKQFAFDGKKYQVIIHAAHIPGLGIRTAMEITVDPDAQAYLVEHGIGSVIEEVAE